MRQMLTEHFYYNPILLVFCLCKPYYWVGRLSFFCCFDKAIQRATRTVHVEILLWMNLQKLWITKWKSIPKFNLTCPLLPPFHSNIFPIDTLQDPCLISIHGLIAWGPLVIHADANILFFMSHTSLKISMDLNFFGGPSVSSVLEPWWQCFSFNPLLSIIF